MTALRRVNLRKISQAGKAEDRQKVRERRYLELEALGSGSDYTPFLQHIGLASLNVGYEGESERRDLPLHLRRLHLVHALRGHRFRVRARPRADRRACSRCGSRTPTSCRSTSPAPPRRSPATSARSPSSRTRSGRKRRRWNLGIEENLPWAVADPKKPFVAPKPRVVPPHFDFSPLQNASDALTDAAKAYSRAYRRGVRFGGGASHRGAARRRQPRAGGVRARLTSDTGLPGRPVVPPLRLRARGLHRLRRQDAARGARGPRGEALGRREPATPRRPRRSIAQALRRRADCSEARGEAAGASEGRPRQSARGRMRLLRRACARRSPGCRTCRERWRRCRRSAP